MTRGTAFAGPYCHVENHHASKDLVLPSTLQSYYDHEGLASDAVETEVDEVV